MAFFRPNCITGIDTTTRHKSVAINRYKCGLIGVESISANPVMQPKINRGRLKGKISTAPKIAALLAPNTSPDAMPPNNVIPNIPSNSESAISIYADRSIPTIRKITGKMISKGTVEIR